VAVALDGDYKGTMTKKLLQPQITFTRIDNTLFEYLRDTTLDVLAFTILAILNREADFSTGKWLGCAERLFYSIGETYKLRAIQERLHALEVSGFITSGYQRGKRGYYPISISNFICSSGPHKGKVLNPRPIIAPSAHHHRAITAPSVHSDAVTPGYERTITAPSPRPSASNQDSQDKQDKTQDTQSGYPLFSHNSKRDSDGVVRPDQPSPHSGAVSGSVHSGAVTESAPGIALPKWSGRDGCFFDGDRKLSMIDAARRFASVGMSHLEAINEQTGGAQ
jgi:hypothetical protein